jgi:hypothetical protein
MAGAIQWGDRPLPGTIEIGMKKPAWKYLQAGLLLFMIAMPGVASCVDQTSCQAPILRNFAYR